MGEWVGSACEAGYSKTVVGLIERGWSGRGSLGTVKAVEVAVVSEEVAGGTCFMICICCDVDGGAEELAGVQAVSALRSFRPAKLLGGRAVEGGGAVVVAGVVLGDSVATASGWGC